MMIEMQDKNRKWDKNEKEKDENWTSKVRVVKQSHWMTNKTITNTTNRAFTNYQE